MELVSRDAPLVVCQEGRAHGCTTVARTPRESRAASVSVKEPVWIRAQGQTSSSPSCWLDQDGKRMDGKERTRFPPKGGVGNGTGGGHDGSVIHFPFRGNILACRAGGDGGYARKSKPLKPGPVLGQLANTKSQHRRVT